MNDDLISRKAAIDDFYNVKVNEEDCTEYDVGYNDGIDYAISKLSAMPSVQLKIVRCKDCLMHGVCRFEQGLGLDGYCSQAKRRTNGVDS